jgi:hypothetical protein
MRRSSGAVLAVVVAVGACKKDPPGTPVRLYTEDEIARLEQPLVARLEENATRTCPRRRLRDTPVAGSAAPQLVELAEGTGTLAACTRRVEEVLDGVKASEATASQDPAIVALDQECGDAYESAVNAIAAHESACSPYQAGVRLWPERIAPVLKSASLLARRMRARAEAGDHEGAIWLAVSSLRTFQDLRRGRVNLLVAMIATAASGTITEELAHVLGSAKLPAGAAQQLAAAFDVLITSEPPFGETMQGERDGTALQLGLRLVRPAGWVPPGGADPAYGDEPFADGTTRIDRRDQGALILALAADDATQKACPETSSLAQCWRGLDALAKRQPRAEPGSDWTALVKELSSAGDSAEARERLRLDIQRRIVAILADIATPNYAEYAAKATRGYVPVIGARLALEAHVLGRCPTEQDLASAPPTLRGPLELGDMVEVSVENDMLTVRAPAWALPTDRDKARAFTARCAW